MGMRDIPEELVRRVKEEAQKFDYQVLEMKRKGKNVFEIDIVLDRLGGITLEECGKFNREIVSWIDGNNIVLGNYSIDVCSPGLDRELRSDEDFRWAENKQVDVTMREPLSGKTQITGTLLAQGGHGTVSVKDDAGSVICIDRDKIAKAKLKVVVKKTN